MSSRGRDDPIQLRLGGAVDLLGSNMVARWSPPYIASSLYQLADNRQEHFAKNGETGIRSVPPFDTDLLDAEVHVAGHGQRLCIEDPAVQISTRWNTAWAASPPTA